jgi:hypothetical protein
MSSFHDIKIYGRIRVRAYGALTLIQRATASFTFDSAD